MRAVLFSLTLSLAGANAAHGQNLPEILVELRETALKSEQAYGLLESLTTEVGQRLAGSPNDARAVAWAKGKMTELGFDKIYTEPVNYPAWERGEESLYATAPYLQRFSVAALGGSMGTGKAAIEAQVVEFADYKAVTQAPANSALGKIVFINYAMSRSRDGAGYGVAVVARVQGAAAAARLGAKALLIRSIGTGQSRSPHTGIMRYDNTPTRIPAAALGTVDADLLSKMLKKGQTTATPVTLKLSLGARTRRADYVGTNVIGEIRGATLPDEIVAIGGHLDSWDLGTGALDDGAGVALTLSAAALIGAQKNPPKRTVRVVLFANEEQGVFGGKAYAAARAKAGEVKNQVIAAESDFGAGRIYELRTRITEADLASLPPLLRALAPLGIVLGNNEAGGSADFGPMRELGAPVADLLQDGTRYFDVHHTENDTLDQVDRADLAQNVAAYALLARFFADK
jgi:Zn-dependent M28 family amino/carboxypeptidase